MSASVLRLHHFEALSQANGPGLRSVVWLQGCTLNCPGCFNPQTHMPKGGELHTVEQVFTKIAANIGRIEGITFSGGEPLQQAPALVELIQRVRSETGLSIVLFTGFAWEEVHRLPQAEAILAGVDVLLAGRYQSTLRVARGLLGSSNKTIHFFTPRYTPADFAAIPQAEVIIGPGGELRFSGIEPLHW